MKRMSVKVFLTKLRKLRGQFEVEAGHSMIRTTDRLSFTEFDDRGNPLGYKTRTLCPIEAVARYLGEPVDDKSLPLHRRTRRVIIEAADNATLGGATGVRRRQMLTALGLKGK